MIYYNDFALNAEALTLLLNHQNEFDSYLNFELNQMFFPELDIIENERIAMAKKEALKTLIKKHQTEWNNLTKKHE